MRIHTNHYMFMQKKVIEKQMNVIATVDQNIVFESPVKNNPVKSIANKIWRYFL